MTTHTQTCSNCGTTLNDEQIALAVDDAGLSTADLDAMTFCCSTYTDEQGCQGNGPGEMAYWYTR